MELQKKNFVEKITNFILNILIFIFGVVLLVSIYTSIQAKILGNNYANFFGYSIFEIQTGSMTGSINAGDCVIVKLTHNVKLNDIVTYELNDQYVTHRIIEAYNDTYVTKGDANNAKDKPITQDQIVGKVVGIWVNFGIFRKILFNPIVLITLIVTLLLFDLAFRKNKENTFKLIRENRKLIVKKICSFSCIVMSKTRSFINFIVKSFNRIIKRKASEKIAENHTAIKTENVNLESYKKAFNADKFKNLPSDVKIDDYYTDADELDKTALFRVIPVDATEVDDKYKAPTKEEVEDYYKDEDELDKTSLYRIVPVDATEVDDTLLEIAKNEIKETKTADKNGVKSDDKAEETDQNSQENKTESGPEDSDSLTNINLELLKNIKSKKSKNIIDAVMYIKEEELNELINVIVKDDKDYVNKATIKEMFITTYIDAKYYNCYDTKDGEHPGKNSITKIEKAIKETALASELVNNSHNNDAKYNDIVDKYASIFILIANLEQAKELVTDSKAKNEFCKKEIKKYSKDWNKEKIECVINETIKIQKSYADTLEYFLKKLDTNTFNLNFNKLVTRKDMYGLELNHNITFSKVYSDYIIDKTYTEGIVAEDKVTVVLSLLSVQLVKDMISSNFNRKYILYIPKSLYKKEKKFEKLLRMIDDKYAKSNIVILITFEDLLSNKKIVVEAKKMGYKFALVFNEEIVIEEKDRPSVYITDYIFINNKNINMKKTSFIPEELLDNAIYEDIIEKVGDFGSD